MPLSLWITSDISSRTGPTRSRFSYANVTRSMRDPLYLVDPRCYYRRNLAHFVNYANSAKKTRAPANYYVNTPELLVWTSLWGVPTAASWVSGYLSHCFASMKWLETEGNAELHSAFSDCPASKGARKCKMGLGTSYSVPSLYKVVYSYLSTLLQLRMLETIEWGS